MRLTRYSVITERRMEIRQHLDSCGYVAELRLRQDMFGGTYKTRGVVSRRHRG